MRRIDRILVTLLRGTALLMQFLCVPAVLEGRDDLYLDMQVLVCGLLLWSFVAGETDDVEN